MNCPVNSDELVEFESTRLSQATKSSWLDSVSWCGLLDAEMGMNKAGQEQNWLDSINRAIGATSACCRKITTAES